MRFIPTKFHAPLDYIAGAALIAAPWVLQFSEHTAATVIPVVLGIGLIAYSLLTDYELGAVRKLPYRAHLIIDAAGAIATAAAPWLLGRKDPVDRFVLLGVGIYELTAVALSDPTGGGADEPPAPEAMQPEQSNGRVAPTPGAQVPA